MLFWFLFHAQSCLKAWWFISKLENEAEVCCFALLGVYQACKHWYTQTHTRTQTNTLMHTHSCRMKRKYLLFCPVRCSSSMQALLHDMLTPCNLPMQAWAAKGFAWNCVQRAGQNHIYIYIYIYTYIYGVCTVHLASKKTNLRSYMVHIYGSGQPNV
jgi:hypothetical protein